MPDQVQLRGGSNTDNDSFTGAAREVTVDTTNKTLRVHDGTTAGGSRLAAYDEWGRLQVADPVNDTDVANKQWVEGQIGESVVLPITAADAGELTFHEGTSQSVSASSYHTIFDIAVPVELIGGSIQGFGVGVRLTIDDTVAINRTTSSLGRVSDGTAANGDSFGLSALFAAKAASSMKLELYNPSGNTRVFGWRVVTR